MMARSNAGPAGPSGSSGPFRAPGPSGSSAPSGSPGTAASRPGVSGPEGSGSGVAGAPRPADPSGPEPTGPTPRGWSTPQIIALIVGLLYTLLGLIGFGVTGLGNFANHTGESLFGFRINPLHNVAHLMMGLLGLAMGRRLASARAYGWLLFLIYGALFLFGLFAVGSPDFNVFAINGADNVLHLLSALIGLAIALWPVQARVRPVDRRLSQAARQ